MSESGIVTRDELLVMGCEERKGRKGVLMYWNTNKMIARVCTKCSTLKYSDFFLDGKGCTGGKRSDCKLCSAIRGKIYRDENPEKARYSYMRYASENREKRREKEKRRRAKYPNYLVEWRAKNPEKRTLYHINRRARKRSLPDDLTSLQQGEILLRFGNSCALSGKSSETQMDHIIPLAIGHGGTTYSNMIPLSAELNLSKNANHIFEWFNANKERFILSQRKFDELIEYLAQVNEMTTQEYRAYVDWCFDNPRDINAIETEGSA